VPPSPTTQPYALPAAASAPLSWEQTVTALLLELREQRMRFNTVYVDHYLRSVQAEKATHTHPLCT